MIAAYAQAADRQGLDVAFDGQLVAADEAGFIKFRKRAISVNFESTVRQVGNAEVSCGKGIIRLEVRDTGSGSTNASPIIVIADAAEVLDDRANAVRRATESIAAIDRQCDAQVVEAAFGVGESLHRSARTKRRVAAAVAAIVITAAIVWLARSCATSENIVSSASPWSR